MSFNWRWHIAAADRLLTDGISMWTTANSSQGLQLLPGRLALDVTGGYAAPTKPVIVDGRLFMRLSDKLVCYDLRRLQDEDQRSLNKLPNQQIHLLASEAIPGAAEGHDSIKLGLRLHDEEIRSIGAHGADWIGDETMHRKTTWANRDFPATRPLHLNLTNESLSGSVSLRLGYHREPWELHLKRDGDNFTGTYTRTP